MDKKGYISEFLKFQFHKGAIKTISTKRLCLTICDFNSIKVRLKQLSQRFCSNAALFQFHKGAIKTSGSYRQGDN